MDRQTSKSWKQHSILLNTENIEASRVKQGEFNINIDQALSKLTTSLSSLHLLLLSSEDKSCFPLVSGLLFFVAQNWWWFCLRFDVGQNMQNITMHDRTLFNAKVIYCLRFVVLSCGLGQMLFTVWQKVWNQSQIIFFKPSIWYLVWSQKSAW